LQEGTKKDNIMDEVYLGLGSNIGKAQCNLESARVHLLDHSAVIRAVSPVYVSEPWGFESKNNFINQVICIHTGRDPYELLSLTQQIEKMMGRAITKKGYSDRIIDIDILFFGGRIISSKSLIIPHPLLHKRMFVLKPMSDIAPRFHHPVFNKSIEQLLEECPDRTLTRKIPV